MNIDCKVTRSGKWWAVEVPVGDRTFYTQDRDLKEARFMAEDILKMCAEDKDLPTPTCLSANICPNGCVNPSHETSEGYYDPILAQHKREKNYRFSPFRSRSSGYSAARLRPLPHSH